MVILETWNNMLRGIYHSVLDGLHLPLEGPHPKKQKPPHRG